MYIYIDYRVFFVNHRRLLWDLPTFTHADCRSCARHHHRTSYWPFGGRCHRDPPVERLPEQKKLQKIMGKTQPYENIYLNRLGSKSRFDPFYVITYTYLACIFYLCIFIFVHTTYIQAKVRMMFCSLLLVKSLLWPSSQRGVQFCFPCTSRFLWDILVKSFKLVSS